MNIKKKPLEEDFWDRVEKTDGCWIWRSYKFNQQGYGKLKHHRKTYLAHRLAWELTHGPISLELDVLHTCDNTACVRPDHLFVGSHQDNMLDRNRKGRARGGRTNPQESDEFRAARIIAIRAAQHDGLSQPKLAKWFGVSQPTVSMVLRHLAWKDL